MEPDSEPEITGPAADQEAILRDYNASREPQTTQNFPLREFTGSVRIQKSLTAGRGLFLDVPAKSGQILLISNNEAACTRSYKLQHARSSMDDPLETDTASSARSIRRRIPLQVQEQLATELATQISSHSEKGLPQVYGYLDYESKDTDDELVLPIPPVDLYHDHSKSKRPHGKQPMSAVDPEVPEERVWGIVAKNASCDDIRSMSLAEPIKEEKCEFWGIWLLPSFINHSCAPNCNRQRVGEALVIRAASNILAGDELFLPYFDIFQPLPLREANAEDWDFRCACARCQFERSLGEDFRNIEKQLIHSNRLLSDKWEKKEDEGGILVELGNLHSDIYAIDRNISAAQKTQKRNRAATKVRQSSKPTWAGVVKRESPWRLATAPNISDDAYMEHVITNEAYIEQVPETLGEDDDDEEQTPTETKWVKASCIDVYIAAYAGSTFARIRAIRRRANHATVWQLECQLVQLILQIISDVHPGNVLGREFGSIFMETLSEVPDPGDEDTNRAVVMGSDFVCEFYKAYYGSNTEVTETLIKYG